MMKVSLVVGGRWHAFDLAKELEHSGVLYRLVTNYPKFKTRLWGIPDEKVVSLPLSLLLTKSVYRVGGEALNMRWQYFLHQRFARPAARHLEGSDIVHGWSSFSLPSLRWARENRVPFVLERSSAHMKVQCTILREEYEKLGLQGPATHPGIVRQELEEYSLADRISVPSIFVKRTFIEEGFTEERLFHNPFGTDLRSYIPGPKNDDVFRVVFAASLSVRKGIHYLVEAFKLADIANSELCLIGGKTRETPKLIGIFDRRIRFVGHVALQKLTRLYQEGSVFVMASIEEGLALVQAQAMACGLPLICTRNTGGEDLLRMGGVDPVMRENGIEEFPAGFLVPPRDSAAIAFCLRALSSNKELRAQKAQSALKLREAGLDWSAYGRRCIGLYESCMNSHSATKSSCDGRADRGS